MLILTFFTIFQYLLHILDMSYIWICQYLESQEKNIENVLVRTGRKQTVEVYSGRR